MLPPDCLHCLTIDFARAPADVAAVLTQRSRSADELRDLLCEAGRASAALLVFPSPTSLTLVSTRHDHVRAFRPILALIREALLGVAGWRGLPVRMATGCDAARELVTLGLSEIGLRRQVREFAERLRAAAGLSKACGALSSELSALVRMAEHTANRGRDAVGTAAVR